MMWEKESVPVFGDEIKRHFMLDSETTFINHGACGATPKYVTEKRFDIVRNIENNPELWYRNKGPKQETSSLKRLANFIGASSHTDLVYVDNTTEGINIILKSLKLESRDQIMCTSHTFVTIRNIINECATRQNADVLCVNIPQKIEDEEQMR